MKFFDLEMNSCWAKGFNKKGGRNVVFSGQPHLGACTYTIYHGGADFNKCAQSSYTSQKECNQTTVQEY